MNGVHAAAPRSMNAAEVTDWHAVQTTARHLQKCLMALEKIRAIDGGGAIAKIADAAINNRPWDAGGTAE